MEIKDLLYEIDFALDSILSIEERVVEKRSTTKIMLTISHPTLSDVDLCYLALSVSRNP